MGIFSAIFIGWFLQMGLLISALPGTPAAGAPINRPVKQPIHQYYRIILMLELLKLFNKMKGCQF
jgi:hypothetical protein